MTRLITILLAALVLGLGAVACGGDDEASTTETTTETSSTPLGQEVFVANCGSCHTLTDAGTTGTIGPSLDAIGLDAAAVEDQVRNGGGGMPAFEGQLSEEEITEVAAYVAATDGS